MGKFDIGWTQEKQDKMDSGFAIFLLVLMFLCAISVFFHFEREDEKKQLQKIYSVDTLGNGDQE